MTTVIVTLKVTPLELQVIDTALHMYAYAMENLNREDYEHPLEGYQCNMTICRGNRLEAVRQANDIRTKIGLR